MAAEERWEYNELPVVSRWIAGNSLEKFKPYTQASVVCFNKEGKVLIVRELNKNWKLPGGKPKDKETPVDTIKREMESLGTIKDIKLIGAVEVDFPSNKELSNFYQLKYIALIDKIKESRKILSKLVDVSELNEYVKWGPVGNEMFTSANEEFEKTVK